MENFIDFKSIETVYDLKIISNFLICLKNLFLN